MLPQECMGMTLHGVTFTACGIPELRHLRNGQYLASVHPIRDARE